MNYFDYNQTFETNKTKYKNLAKKLHPDVGGTNQKFIELQKEWKKYEQNYLTKKLKFNTEKKTETYKYFEELMQQIQKESELMLKKNREEFLKKIDKQKQELQNKIKKQEQDLISQIGNYFTKKISKLFK